MQGICAPGLLPIGDVVSNELIKSLRGEYIPPYVTLNAETGEVAAPVAPRPSRTLVQELDPILKGRLQLALTLVLDPRLPAFLDQPARHKVVVVGVQVEFAPPLIPEATQELAVVENLGPVSSRAPRHAGGSAVDVVRGGDFEVAALNVSHTEPVPAAGCEGCIGFPAHSLAGADATHLGVFERSENPAHHGRGPRDIVISHDGNGGLNLGKRSANLESLVRPDCEQNTNARGVKWSLGLQRIRESLQLSMLLSDGDQYQLVGLTGQDAPKWSAEFLHPVVDGGEHNSHISRSELGLLRYRF